jgi:hypothetical protein
MLARQYSTTWATLPAVLEFWIQGLGLARHVLYHFSYALTPFCFSYFLDRVSSFCQGLASYHKLPCWK